MNQFLPSSGTADDEGRLYRSSGPIISRPLKFYHNCIRYRRIFKILALAYLAMVIIKDPTQIATQTCEI